MIGTVVALAATAALALPAAGIAAKTPAPGVPGAVSTFTDAFGSSHNGVSGQPKFGGQSGTMVASSLMTRVQTHPKQVFHVIVTGTGIATNASLAKAINSLGKTKTGRQFKSITGVSATITGADLQTLAKKYPKLVQAITVDRKIRTADYQDAQMWTSTADITPLWNSADGGPAPQAPGIAFIDSGINAADTVDFGNRVVESVSFCSLCTDTAAATTTTAAAPVSSTADTSATAAPAGSTDTSSSTAVASSSTTDSSATADTSATAAQVTALTPAASTFVSDDLEGHGTMVAGIAAGSNPDYPGVAQNAPIVSVRVANGDGESMESDVIAACDWILANKDTYGIKVVNISMAGSSPTSFQFDPLDQAVERLWFAGVTVVAAAGNFGDGSAVDMSAAPGNDPFIITVGAVDQNETADPYDDTVAPWSAFGYTADGFSKPDVVAPGRYMIMPVPMGTTIPNTVPDRVVSPGYMWMSGTSFASPVVAGAAAQILAVHPDWTPDEVKGALMLTSAYLPNVDWQASGVGEIDAATAASLPFDPPNPNENLDAFVSSDPSSGQPVFDSAAWASSVSSDAAWSSAAWSSAAWASAAWASAAWASAAWSSAAWASSVNSAMTSLATYTEATYSP